METCSNTWKDLKEWEKINAVFEPPTSHRLLQIAGCCANHLIRCTNAGAPVDTAGQHKGAETDRIEHHLIRSDLSILSAVFAEKRRCQTKTWMLKLMHSIWLRCSTGLFSSYCTWLDCDNKLCISNGLMCQWSGPLWAAKRACKQHVKDPGSLRLKKTPTLLSGRKNIWVGVLGVAPNHPCVPQTALELMGFWILAETSFLPSWFKSCVIEVPALKRPFAIMISWVPVHRFRR